MDGVAAGVGEELFAQPDEIAVDQRERFSFPVPQHELPGQHRCVDLRKLVPVEKQVVAAAQGVPRLHDRAKGLAVGPFNRRCGVDQVERAPHPEHDVARGRHERRDKGAARAQELPRDGRPDGSRLLCQEGHRLPRRAVRDRVTVGLLKPEHDVAPLDAADADEGVGGRDRGADLGGFVAVRRQGPARGGHQAAMLGPALACGGGQCPDGRRPARRAARGDRRAQQAGRGAPHWGRARPRARRRRTDETCVWRVLSIAAQSPPPASPPFRAMDAAADAAAAAPPPHTALDDWADAHAGELHAMAPDAARTAIIEEYTR